MLYTFSKVSPLKLSSAKAFKTAANLIFHYLEKISTFHNVSVKTGNWQTLKNLRMFKIHRTNLVTCYLCESELRQCETMNDEHSSF